MGYQEKTLEPATEFFKAYTDPSDEGCWYVAYSGGKDSTVTVAEVMRWVMLLPPDKRSRKIHIVSAQTGLDLTTDPTKQREFERMQVTIEKHGLPFEIHEVKADLRNHLLFQIVGLGYPLPAKSRLYCTDRMKLEPMERFEEEYRPTMKILGARRVESKAREKSVNKHLSSKYFSEEVTKKGRTIQTFMPIVEFTVEDVWGYLAERKTPWGDAEEISQIYKDATGECGLSKRKAGKGETAEACGARFGCVICPVVTIDKSTKETAKKKPWFEPYVELRELIISMYKDPRNRAGRMRNGKVLCYGEGTFTVKARMELFEAVMEAQRMNERIARTYGADPQALINSELAEAIQQQWMDDLRERPWLEDAAELGLFYEERIKGNADKWFQLTWNHLYEGA
ncbi:phosphoadenosine phosphosulfate reductase family protein [Brevibacillus borstelensis]|uniref:phosphoadenosine phosphosulfate reductase domain-containing protein n=1 Tax=Brevibacillus borstelensis TaxID=45462 RepID=UPI0004F26700|nr:phosphoadenosine phosphosulfate reductase family protein [Brevibacillus borstelensis]KKX53260.1 hypothetical protein X546_20500 [Brevibacillus borstelensis cifa_chp40]